jgi:RNA polymerase sigma factor (sigma-70 family)
VQATLSLPMSHAALEERFRQILSAHGPAIRRAAHVYSRSASDAADLAQDIAVALWRALPSFRGESSERTFVFRIAHNRGISHAEARRTRERVTPLMDTEVMDPAPTPEEAVDRARVRATLLQAIAELPIGARAVITLALEGLSHEEIAAVLGTTANSVAVRLNRARRELSARMQERS